MVYQKKSLLSMSTLNTSPDLNGSQIDVFERPPTALEFARMVHISRPVIIKGQAKGRRCN